MTFAERLWTLATDPSVTPEKLEIAAKAIADSERREAERKFHAAFLKLQKALPEVGKHGELIRDGKVIANYSRFEDIQRAIREPLQGNGFTLSRHNAFPRERCIEVVVVLTHVGGHHTENSFQLNSDEDLAANANQQMASAQSYAARYATAGLLNLILAETDDDGERSARQVAQPVETSARPEGYDRAMKMLDTAVKKGGLAAFQKAYKDTPMAIKDWAVANELDKLNAIKKQAHSPKQEADAPIF